MNQQTTEFNHVLEINRGLEDRLTEAIQEIRVIEAERDSLQSRVRYAEEQYVEMQV